MAKKRKGSGRVTPKGTKPPEKQKKDRHTDLPEPPAAAPDQLPPKLGRGTGRVSRPITHNRGNR